MINVIIADDQAIFRAGAAKVLAVEEDLRIVGQPQSSEQLLNALEKLRSHVLLFAASFMPFYPEIRRVALRQGTALLILAENNQSPSTFMEMGMQGVIFRSVTGAIIVDAVRRLARGEQYVQSVLRSGPNPNEDFVGARVRDRLSPKEMRIVAAIVRGFKNREIAESVGTSEQVIKNALRAIYDKMGVNDRLELALFVLHHRALAHAIAAVQLRMHLHGVGPESIRVLSETSKSSVS
jgi:DNA-binding NarL/FixJ family response regulator